MNSYIQEINNTDRCQTRIVISKNNWLEDSAVEQLKQTMTLEGMRIGVGMPDLHPGKGQPIGAVFVSENCIYPHLVGSDIGCGMGLWQLDIPLKKVKLDKWEKQLDDLDCLWDGDIATWLSDRSVDYSDDSFIEHNEKLGTIGGGNHFVEFQKIKEVVQPELFEASGLDKQRVMLLVHSGSRGLGQHISRMHIDVEGANAIPSSDHDRLKAYLKRHDYAVSWAIANRELIAERFCQKLKAKKEMCLDETHNMVESLDREKAQAFLLSTSEQSQYWIHRKGVSTTEQPWVVIPGSRGDLSYLVKPTRDKQCLTRGAFSLAHGAGRKWKRSDVRSRLHKRFTVKDLERTTFGSRVICQQRDLLYEEAPQAYKSISHVINDLVGAGLIEVVATLQPLMTYKTRRK